MTIWYQAGFLIFFFPRLWIGTVPRQTGIYYAVYSRTWISVAMVKAVAKIFIRYSLHQHMCLLILIIKNLGWDFIQVKYKGGLEAIASFLPILKMISDLQSLDLEKNRLHQYKWYFYQMQCSSLKAFLCILSLSESINWHFWCWLCLLARSVFIFKQFCLRLFRS